MSLQYACITFRYQPFFLNTVSLFPFPHSAVQSHHSLSHTMQYILTIPFPTQCSRVSPFPFPHNAVVSPFPFPHNAVQSHHFLSHTMQYSLTIPFPTQCSTVSPFPFPHIAVQTFSTIYINKGKYLKIF